MRTSLLAGLLALTTSVVAQDPYWNITSAPFYLVLKGSRNSSLNGEYLGACHEGAGIEGLCLTDPTNSTYAQFNYNTSLYLPQPATTGILVWNLEVNSGTLNVSSSMRLSYNLGSNVAMPIIFPGSDEYTEVSFDKDGKMGLGGYFQDDTKPLPAYTEGPLYRWYICATYYGYLYPTLAWTLGKHSPQNPSCQKVNVYRKFV